MEKSRQIAERDRVMSPLGERALLSLKNERVIEDIVAEARTKTIVVPEGPPIYLWPALVEQRWDNPAFVKGWGIVNAVSGKLPKQKLRHYVLIDDLNYRPEGVTEQTLTMRMGGVWQTADDVAKSPIFNDDKGEAVRISEAELSVSVGSTVCSVLDARFNKQKITDQMRDFGKIGLLHYGNLERLMLLVVSPDTAVFKAEQLNMAQALYELLRQDPAFAKASKEQTRNAITNTYRHIWLDRKTGEVSDKTKIVFANNKFMFQNVSF